MGTIVAVFVLYKMRLEDSPSFLSIIDALSFCSSDLLFYVYDNSPNKQYKEDDFVNQVPIKYKHDEKNSGLSKAYNAGANWAKSQKANWILLFDQDTVFMDNFFERLIFFHDRFSGVGLYAPILKLSDQSILSPYKYQFHRGFPIKTITSGKHSLKKMGIVNSGMLIRLDNFFEVGGYNEKVPLDFSDFQFIERYRTKFDSFCVTDSIGIQHFSNNEPDVNKLAHRYLHYCIGAHFCNKESIFDRIIYFVIVFLRAISLTKRTRKNKFLTIFYHTYCRNDFSLYSNL